MQDTMCGVVLIAGFLGSGKTTLLTHILSLSNLSRTAVLVNEFGAVGIDGELLQEFDIPVVEMANGCICCSLQAGFRRSVEEILDRFDPRRILIEATGVADPQDITTLLNEPLFDQKLSLDKTITVVDVDFWEGRSHLGPVFFNQIKAADLILLNKIDVQPPEKVTKYISEIRRQFSSSIIPTYRCRVDPEVLWNGESQIDNGLPRPFPIYVEQGSQVARDHHHEKSNANDLGYVNFSFETTARLDEDCFYSFIASVPDNLYRIKGYVLLGENRFFVNHVGGKTEWVGSHSKEGTRLAFVGWQVDEKSILDRLRKCLLS